jgi:hypothetical protein
MLIVLVAGLCLDLVQAMAFGRYENPEVEYFKPIYLSWEELRSSIKSESPRPIHKRGKIGIRGDYLFINEPNVGVHVFNNRDPSHPVAIAFLKIPGNVDLAVKGDVLYVDSFVDLVALDISTLPQLKELNRQVDVFPYNPYQMSGDEYWYFSDIDKTQGVVVGKTQTRGSK